MEKEAEKVDERDAKAKSLGAVHVFEVEGKRIYVKQPPRHVIGFAFAQMETNRVQACETLIRASAIEEVSDLEILKNDILFMSLMADIGDFLATIELKKSTSRKL
jgi:hypothetical protein